MLLKVFTLRKYFLYILINLEDDPSIFAALHFNELATPTDQSGQFESMLHPYQFHTIVQVRGRSINLTR